jgi:hypothetical protein
LALTVIHDYGSLRHGSQPSLVPTSFIAYNYNTPVDTAAFAREAKRILAEVEQECGWMYETWHPQCDHPQRVKARINYTVWSKVFACPYCSGEITFLEEALDEDIQRVCDEFPCGPDEVEEAGGQRGSTTASGRPREAA